MQHLTETLTEGPIVAGITVAHRPTLAARPAKPQPGDRAYDGSPTTRWPNCMTKPHDWMKLAPSRWFERSAGRALELGAVPCIDPACADEVKP